MKLNFIKILDLDFFVALLKFVPCFLNLFFAEYTLMEGGFYLSATMSWVLLWFDWDTSGVNSVLLHQ